ncbi:MAG: 50S ribosomal protein L15 [Candidatus Jorgensenbacteria bacterium]
MQIHNLKNSNKKDKKRVGRGGKRGTYSGRGQKGQRSRSGHRIRPAFRDLLIRIPKLRGVKNRSFRPKFLVLNIGDLEKLAKDGVLDKKVLLEKKIIKRANQPVKVLSMGDLKKPLTIEGLAVSEKAKEKILKSGGTIK